MVRRNLKVGTSTFEKPRTIGSLKLRSVSSASSVKLSKVMGIDGEADTSIAKETDVNCTALEIKNVENDPDSIQRMTVQELRKKLRSLGVPAKGCKRDLVDALKDSLHSNSSGKESLVVEDCGSPEIKPICSRNNPKRKVESLSAEVHAENISTVSKVSAVKRTKKGVKQARAEETIVDVKTKLLATKPELRTNEVTAKKSSRTKRKVPTDINSGAYVVSKMVDLPEIQYEPWTILTHKKPQKGWVPYNPRTMRPPPLTADTKHVKLMSWNVNGLRALLKLEGFSAVQLAQREDFDVLCLQETKLQEKDIEAIKCSLLEGYEDSFWTCSVSKLGYSGTAIISRIKPLSVRYGLGISDHDSEGRLVTVEFDTFYLISGYVPNSGDGLRRLSYRVSEWDPSLSSYMKELEKSKPVVLTGDLNCAHEEIDIFNPAGNKRSAGFTDEERQSFEKNFLNMGFVDTFRKQHPGIVGYTYWGYRHNGRKTNKGWRLDYFLVSESIADEVYDSYILPDIGGSDHSPVGLILKL